MKNKGFVSIIMINYNGKKFNKQCIDSILEQDYSNFEIVFVDNQSSDGSLEDVEILYKKEIKDKKIKIIKNTENSGFAGGNNLGVLKSSKDSEYICMLNNDTIVPKNWLGELVLGISEDPSLGGIGSVILNKGNENETLQLLDKRKGVRTSQFLNGYRNISEKEIKKGVYYTNFISGCSFLYRKNIIDIPFEEYYFLYCEDVYLNWRIMNLGYNLGIAVNSKVFHYGGGSTGGVNSFTMYHLIRNKLINRIIFNNYISMIFLFPLYLITEIICILNLNTKIKLRNYPKAWKWIYQNRDKILKTREKIERESKLGPWILFNKKHFSYNLIDFIDIKKHINGKLYYCILPIITAINIFFSGYQNIIFYFANLKNNE